MGRVKFSREYSVSLLEREPKMRFKKGEDFIVWQKNAKEKLWDLLGLDEMLRCNDDDFVIEKTEKLPEYTAVDFSFQSEQGYYVPCSVYTPTKNNNGNTVICIQGHSTGKHVSIAQVRHAYDENCIERDSDYALQAVKNGYTAVCIEQRYMGVCGSSEQGYPHCSVKGASLPALLLGRCAIGERVWDVMRLIDVIQNRFPELNLDNLICVGNSGGGTATFYAACIDDRIKCAVPSCSVCTFKGSIGEIHHCACNYIPGIAKYFDMGDLGALVAPRTLIVVNGNEDEIFPDSEVRKCFALIKEGYKNAEAEEKCRLVTGDGGHRFFAEATWKEISNCFLKPFISEFYKEPQIITHDDGGHYFFGYYDMRASQGNRHLCHRVDFMDRLPTEKDEAELGFLENGKFFPFAKTVAWNFQQGAMLQYHPTKKDTVYYNTVKNGCYCTATHNYKTGEIKYTDRATACVSPDGNWGLAVNFGRIFDFRPGYGYAGFCDDNANQNAPLDDGVFLTDMETGKSKLLISYKEILQPSGFNSEDKILVNHITFNKTSNRYIMLVRNFPLEEGEWSTSMLVGDLKGNVKAVLSNTYVSHYDWLNGEEILAHCTVGKEKGMFKINVPTGEWTEYDMPYFHLPGNPDIHCNYSPDKQFIIGDGYPHNGYRSLLAYNLQSGNSATLLSVLTDVPSIIDIRCDLHARFVFDGEYISFDTTHNGKREIAMVSADVLKNLD